MDSGGGTTRTTSNTSGGSSPWKPSQGYLKTNMAEADALREAGVGGQVFDKSTVVPYSLQTSKAMDGTLDYADKYGGMATKPFESLSGQVDYLSPIARGDFSNDATFNQTLGRAQEDVSDQVNLTASAAGRYGSGVHQGNLTREVGDMTNRAMLDRQRWAQDGLMQSSLAMPSAYQGGQAGLQDYQRVGGMYEDLMTRQLNDEIRLHNEKNQMPWQPLQMSNAIAAGAGSLGGTNTSTSSTTAPSNEIPAWQKYGGAGLQILGSGLFG